MRPVSVYVAERRQDIALCTCVWERERERERERREYNSGES